jgi:hypothetical protein
MEVRSSSGSRHWGRAWERKTPGATRGQTFETPTLVVPVARARIAVVRMKIPGEQVLASGAQGTILCADEREVPTLIIVKRDLAGDGGRARMLPPVTLAASMGMAGVLCAHQRLARRSPSSTVLLVGASSNAR